MARDPRACDNSCMQFDESTGSDVPPPPTTTRNEPRPRRGLRSFGRGVSWSTAVLAVPLGIAVSWITAWLGNCKLGFFGETGPDVGAGSFTFADLGAQSVGWLIAVVPWLIVARWNAAADRRRLAVIVVIVVSAVVLVGVMLPQLGGVSYWEQVCT